MFLLLSVGLRTVPAHEVAFRCILTGVEASALFGLADNQLAAAFRALAAGLLKERAGVPAFREARAGQEAAVRSELDDHLPSAELADFVGLFVRHFDAFKVLGRRFDLIQERRAEAPENFLPFGIAFGDLVQFRFHLRRM